MPEIHIDKKYIPLDKSWIIRMGILDMINGYGDIQKFLSLQENLGDDLLALEKVTNVWESSDLIDVGESGTLYRLLKFVSWKLNLNKKFITHGTLAERKVTDDPEIIYLSQSELLKLDNNTSQWATASVLLGDSERLTNSPFKLRLSYEAVEHWKSQREKRESWEPRYDETILNQAEVYLQILKVEKPIFIPKQAEDFCFAYVFGYITQDEGEKRWPSLRGHESDRVSEMKNVLELARDNEDISSKDHRVVQAIAMWGKVNRKKVNIKYPESVNKSWPQFWKFLEAYN
ncbi:hypothetical protein H0W91_03910 [Patescibacteria group bacterium]|nr:hypothetical protein [Patescibacteria group bacterium]